MKESLVGVVVVYLFIPNSMVLMDAGVEEGGRKDRMIKVVDK